jgi:hypothetical protein
MATDHLVGDGLAHAVDVEPALLAGDPGHEHDLDEEIPELLTQLVRITGGDRVHDLVGLLEKVGSEGMERLLPVPRTPPRVAQMVHDGDETIKC